MKKWPWVLGVLFIVGSFIGGYYTAHRSCGDSTCNGTDTTSSMPTVVKLWNNIAKTNPDGSEAVDMAPVEEAVEALGKEFSFSKFSVCHRFDLGIYSALSVQNPAASNLKPKLTLGYSPFAYGRDKEKKDYRFLRLGVGVNTDGKVDVVVAPIMVNLNRGHKTPWVGNTFITPYVGANVNSGDIVVGLGLNLSF